jgi:phenylpropionate dioxygenase-like ring-hydroxylating dioxygenase large terminal subunit
VHQGFVWLNTEQNSSEGPPNIPGWSEPGYSRVIWHSELETDLQSAAENFLDATHTHFVHAGLIRTEGKRRRVLATTRSVDGGVEAEYEEGQQAGWIMRLLAGGCGKIESFGRFVLPGLAQLEYRTETGHHAYISAFLAPSQPGHIQAHVVFTFKWGHICRWLCPLIAPLFRLALRQDMRILRLQREAQRYWPEFNGLSSPLDLLGPKIEALLRASAAGRALPHWNEKQTELFL